MSQSNVNGSTEDVSNDDQARAAGADPGDDGHVGAPDDDGEVGTLDHGALSAADGTGTDGQVATTESQVAITDGQVAVTDGQVAVTDGDGSDGRGADGNGHPTLSAAALGLILSGTGGAVAAPGVDGARHKKAKSSSNPIRARHARRVNGAARTLRRGPHAPSSRPSTADAPSADGQAYVVVPTVPAAHQGTSPRTPQRTSPATERTGGFLRRTSRRQRLALAAAVLAVMALAALLVLRSSVPQVIVSTARPAVIDARPGGMGQVDVPAGKQFALSTGQLSVTSPLQVKTVDVVAGTRVKVGDPILELDPAPIQAHLQQISTQLDQAQALLAQNQQALSQVSTAGQRLSIQTQIQTETGQVALQSQLLQIAKGNSSTMTSPIDGVVGSVSVNPGETVATNKTLVQILDPSKIQVASSIPLTDLATVAPGDAVTITFPDLPATTLSGTLVSVSPRASAGGQSGTVIVTADNDRANPVPLSIRAFVSVRSPRRAAVTVPRLAVFNSLSAPAVYVVTNGRVKRVPVAVGAQDDSRAEIRSGLSAGQQVALTGTQTLSDGEKVRVARVQR